MFVLGHGRGRKIPTLEDAKARLQAVIAAVQGTPFEVSEAYAGEIDGVRLTAVLDDIHRLGELLDHAEQIRQKLKDSFGEDYALSPEVVVREASLDGGSGNGGKRYRCEVQLIIVDSRHLPPDDPGPLWRGFMRQLNMPHDDT